MRSVLRHEKHMRGKTGMKPVERMLAVMRHEEPDRVPHFEWLNDQALVRQMSGGGD